MRTILLIDDEKKMRQKFKKLLKTEKFRVLEAESAIEVADILMREHSTIDLILLDMNLPEVDGRGIFDIVDEYAPELPIIITSVNPINDQKLQIPRAVDYYQKLQDEKILLTKVRSALGLTNVSAAKNKRKIT